MKKPRAWKRWAVERGDKDIFIADPWMYASRKDLADTYVGRRVFRVHITEVPPTKRKKQ